MPVPTGSFKTEVRAGISETCITIKTNQNKYGTNYYMNP